MSGELRSVDDTDPSAIGMWKVKDDVLAELQANPFILAPNANAGLLSSSEFLKESDFELVDAKLNTNQKRINISGKLDRPFCNFHPSHTTAQDYKTRYALEDTEFWGAYMTDIIKDYEEKISSNVKKYLNNNPDFEKENVDRFERELSDIQAVNPTIIAFGNESHRILNKHFKNKYKIYKVPHYSSNISKEQLREKFIEIQQKI